MASNKELIAKITELDSNAETEGLNNVQLAELLAAVKTPPADADSAIDAATDGDVTGVQAGKDAKAETIAESNKAQAERDKAAETDAPKPAHVVAEGKAITSKRGILVGGEGIAADDLSGGADAFAALLKSKHIVKT